MEVTSIPWIFIPLMHRLFRCPQVSHMSRMHHMDISSGCLCVIMFLFGVAWKSKRLIFIDISSFHAHIVYVSLGFFLESQENYKHPFIQRLLISSYCSFFSRTEVTSITSIFLPFVHRLFIWPFWVTRQSQASLGYFHANIVYV